MELTVTPAAVTAGWLISHFGIYLPENFSAWTLLTLGPGLMTLLHYSSGTHLWAPLPIPMSAGIGILYSSATFPVLAPLSPSLAGQALAFQAFCRSLGSVFGITIGSTTLANELAKKLPREYIASLAGGAAAAYADIPNVKYLAEPLRTEVRVAFGESIRVIWLVLIPFGAVGLVMCCFMRQIELQSETDEASLGSGFSAGSLFSFHRANGQVFFFVQKWGLKDKRKDPEQAVVGSGAEKTAPRGEAELRP